MTTNTEDTANTSKSAPPGADQVVFEVAGKEYTLRFDLDSLDRLEIVNAGTPYQSILQAIQQQQHISLSALTKLVWCGLVDKHRAPAPDGDGLVTPAHARTEIIANAPGQTIQEQILFMQEVTFRCFLSVMLKGQALKTAQDENAKHIQGMVNGLREIQ